MLYHIVAFKAAVTFVAIVALQYTIMLPQQ